MSKKIVYDFTHNLKLELDPLKETWFVDVDGTLAEFGYNNKIFLTQKEWDTDSNILKNKKPTHLVEQINYLKEWKNRNIIILTNIPKNKIFAKHVKARENWLKKHLKVPYQLIINLEGVSKANYITNKGDILVDDNIKNLIEWEIAGGKAIHISTYV